MFELLRGKAKRITVQRLQVAFHRGLVKRNGQAVSSEETANVGDLLEADFSYFYTPKVFAEDIPLDIRYEDDFLMVLVKPTGMACHAGLGTYKGTLANALQGYRLMANTDTSYQLVHRLDKATSGLMVVAKSPECTDQLKKQFESGNAKRKYLAVVKGSFLKQEDTIRKNIGRDPLDQNVIRAFEANSGGKSAVTHYRVLAQNNELSLVECILETGRTHQIRIHMASEGHPIVGDSRYGSGGTEMKLQSYYLSFIHPNTSQLMEFTLAEEECLSLAGSF